MSPKSHLAPRTDTAPVDLVSCPECQEVAEVEWRDAATSTDGPVELVKIRCLHGHWFLMPGERLPTR